MSNILSSVTRIVFLLFSITTCVGFVLGKVQTDQFMGLVGMMFIAYYRTNQSTSEGETDANVTKTTAIKQTIETVSEPVAKEGA